jgi:predicted O-methyltransferase YrrM
MSDNSPQNKLRVIDDYIQDLFPPDEALLHALDNSQRNELPPINVSPNEGRLLYLLARLCGARSILEIGTLGGFSTINLARALPDGGKLITLEYSPKHAEVARANIERAGLSDRVEVRIGAGLDLLPQLEANGEGPFDLFFIDADKDNYPGYLDWCVRLSRPGSVILSDNLVRGHRPPARQHYRPGDPPLQPHPVRTPAPRNGHTAHRARERGRPGYLAREMNQQAAGPG